MTEIEDKYIDVPGFFAQNLIASHPFLGTPKVLTSAGSLRLKVAGEDELKLPLSLPTR